MSEMTSYVVAALLALALHAAVVGMLMVNWGEEATLTATPVQQYYIEATVLAENPHKVRKQKEAQARASEQRRVRARREAEQRAAEEAASRRALEEKKQAAANLEEAEAARRRADELASLEQLAARRREEKSQQEDAARAHAAMEENLALAVSEELGARRAITDDEKVMAYVGQIQRDIVDRWSRPPSARNGMEALLRVYLVPTGEVVDVRVERSSGNDAFDRSAMLAVTRAERFDVPAEPRQFEQNFREFTVLFRPEDLRL